MNNVILTPSRIQQLAIASAKDVVKASDFDSSRTVFYPLKVYGIPRGGVPCAFALAHALEKMSYGAGVCDDVMNADIIVDDIVDSGATMLRCIELNPSAIAVSLLKKPRNDPNWYTFPWEGTDPNAGAIDIPTRLLQFIGEDVKREGLSETPQRFLDAWREYTCGYTMNTDSIFKSFEDGAQDFDEMIIVRDIPVYSTCEHHLAPFFGTATFAYIPDKKILGLSKFARLCNVYMRRLQVQERLTTQLVDALFTNLAPKGVGVVLSCRHLCMESRGVRTAGSITTTSALRGVMKRGAARAEFMRLMG